MTDEDFYLIRNLAKAIDYDLRSGKDPGPLKVPRRAVPTLARLLVRRGIGLSTVARILMITDARAHQFASKDFRSDR